MTDIQSPREQSEPPILKCESIAVATSHVYDAAGAEYLYRINWYRNRGATIHRREMTKNHHDDPLFWDHPDVESWGTRQYPNTTSTEWFTEEQLQFPEYKTEIQYFPDPEEARRLMYQQIRESWVVTGYTPLTVR